MLDLQFPQRVAAIVIRRDTVESLAPTSSTFGDFQQKARELATFVAQGDGLGQFARIAREEICEVMA